MPSISSPSSRIPLRERCNIDLRVDTSGRQRRIQRQKPPTISSEPAPYMNPESRSFSAKVQRYTGLRSNCIGEVIPGMFIAFHDDKERAVKVSEGGKQFTHVISISSSKSSGLAVEYSSTYVDGSHIRALHLTISPKPASTNFSRPPRLSLSLSQLRMARDFLSLALPYTPDSSPTAWSTSCTRLLITTPLGRPVDAVCVIATYLSFTSGEDFREVLNGINEIEELDNVWKSRVCEQDVEFAQLVAEEEEYSLS